MMHLLRTLKALLLAVPFFVVGVAAAQPAQRVIALAPNLTELAYAAGLGPQMVAASEYADYPPAAEKLERVANWQGINLERIVALKPDLVLAWRGGNPQRSLDQLRALGVPVITLDPQSIDQVAAALDQLAGYSAAPDTAHQAAQQLRADRDALQQQYARAAPLPVLLQFGTRPLFTASGQTLQSEVLRLCGAQNLFADSRVPWPQVSREQVLMRRPAAIVTPGDRAAQQAVAAWWQPQLNVPVIALNSDWFSRAGPRIMLAARQLCPQLAALPASPSPARNDR
ncbi:MULTISPECIES: vitamin B12 ABC transporter substrate-binding protein BtuF [Yersiniaceae]|jgi:vitamin B12 transport system substrate-binding protein|uniref:Vitamin B12-binding protein n=2 Tax=Yersiniaceae TaxID=1903411 RepID=A0A2N5EKC5_9GAMM|nr:MULTISPECIES: vitamin B12 ABC transporter substrate-binding protein BtuF [Yersiniaceae]MBS0968947.1 vitamin B12 ABC transporter substrate-binding protein BtuF [Nissabacter archeti]MDV5138880.1 vitamin B12 ABC transporter substrate-binding protein BtuF [Chimaeribacter arupi]PLR33232.1 vitamin B12 ABC transporter substrate-binding protein BtuF [Chimaeribacter arupi]PLR46768.1 vitamin B12 ABC transporter substrate-binding protein BtuF [Chimaeribacter arupi]PLR48127.1 vitamin B12 ABC transporte